MTNVSGVSGSYTMMNMNTMISIKEMMTIVTSVRSSLTTKKMKTMICNNLKKYNCDNS